MFGFKSKKVKKLERMCDMLEMQNRELEEEYMRFKIAATIDHTITKKIVPLCCSVEVDTTFGEFEAVRFGKEEAIRRLADALGDYVDFSVTRADVTLHGSTRRVIEARIRVLEKEGGDTV